MVLGGTDKNTNSHFETMTSLSSVEGFIALGCFMFQQSQQGAGWGGVPTDCFSHMVEPL